MQQGWHLHSPLLRFQKQQQSKKMAPRETKAGLSDELARNQQEQILQVIEGVMNSKQTCITRCSIIWDPNFRFPFRGKFPLPYAGTFAVSSRAILDILRSEYLTRAKRLDADRCLFRQSLLKDLPDGIFCTECKHVYIVDVKRRLPR